MRGTKAKRLRRLGLRSGPAARPAPTEAQVKAVEKRQVAARAEMALREMHGR